MLHQARHQGRRSGHGGERGSDCGKPAVIECHGGPHLAHTGMPAVGWWDVPIPEYMEGRGEYEKAAGEEDV